MLSWQNTLVNPSLRRFVSLQMSEEGPSTSGSAGAGKKTDRLSRLKELQLRMVSNLEMGTSIVSPLGSLGRVGQ